MRLRVCCLLSGSCARWREHKELVVGSRRAEEGVEIHHDLRGKLDGARCMVDGQPGIVRENEWVGSDSEVDKRVCQFEYPNGVKSLMRRSPSLIISPLWSIVFKEYSNRVLQ